MCQGRRQIITCLGENIQQLLDSHKKNTLNYKKNHFILLFGQFLSRCNLSQLELHKIAAKTELLQLIFI